MEVKIAIRRALRRPGLTVARLLTLILVVTAVTTVFTVANVTFLKPLPFPAPEKLVRIVLQPAGTTEFAEALPLYPLAFQHLRDNVRQLQSLEGIWTQDRAVEGNGDPESITAGLVSAGFFRLLGARFVAGRSIQPQDVQQNAKVAVISYGFWQRRFAADPNIMKRVLIVDGEPHTIIGVTTREFEPDFTDTQFWTPLFIRSGAPAYTAVQTIGLLRDGIPGAATETELNTLLGDLRSALPSLASDTARIVDLRYANFGATRPALLILLAAVGLLGLLAAANLANLTLADSESRRGDFAVAAALGASRLDLAKPEIILSFVLALLGGLTGLLLASVLAPAVLTLDPSGIIDPRLAVVDWRVAVVAFAFALIVMLGAIAVPALRVAGSPLSIEMASAGKSAITNARTNRTRLALVMLQTALALLLLSSGALIFKTLQLTGREDPGFDPSNVITAQVQLSPLVYPGPADRAAFIDRVIENVSNLPGIESAATTLNTFQPGFGLSTFVEVFDRPSPDGQPYAVQYRRVSPGYFHTMRIRLLAGRDFDRHDRTGSNPVAIVSRGFARRFWPNEDPIGKQIKRGPVTANWSIVVGMVEDVRDLGIHQPPADTLYTPYFQGNSASTPVALLVRTAGDPTLYLDAIRRSIWQVNASQPMASVLTLETFLSRSLGPQRFRAILIGACSTIGLLLALIGIYAVTARSVEERRRETGLRLALGGQPYSVWWIISWTSVRAVFVGAVLGTAASAGASAALSALLPEVRNIQPVLTGCTALALVAVGALAALIAARSAIRIEPYQALRSQ